MSKRTYTYQSLDEKRMQIRVLCFEPDSHLTPETQVRCHLRHVSLEDAPNHVAISYAWGTDKSTKKITLDGEEFEVRISTESALRGLYSRSLAWPKPDFDVPVWIYGICIDQENEHERSSQMKMMTEIYGYAQKVLAWLGPESGTTAEAIRSIDVMYEECNRITNGFQKLIPLSSSIDGNLVPRQLPPSCNLFALVDFYTAEWFTRIWPVQEIIMAKEAVMVRGTHAIFWQPVCVVGQWVGGRARVIPGLMDRPTIEVYKGGAREGLRNAGIYWAIKTNVNGKGRSPHFLFNDACFFNSTDPRDKVWGMYGLLKFFKVPSNQLRLIEPDTANKTVAQVYAAATFITILNDRQLTYLSLATPWQSLNRYEKAVEGTCPSWAFKFDKVKFEEDRPQRSTDFSQQLITGVCAGPAQLSGELNITCQLNRVPHVLTVKGIVHSSVTSVGNPIQNLRIINALKEGDYPSLAKELLTSWRPPALDPLVTTFTNHSDLMEEVGIAAVNGLAGPWATVRHIGDPGKSNRDFLQDYAAFLLRLLERLGPMDAKLIAQLRSWGPERGSAPAYMQAMCLYAANKVLFTTDADVGKVGAGPVDMKPGDAICFLPGSKVPLILRRYGEYWQMVGQCYVCRVMNVSFRRPVQCGDARRLNTHSG